MAETSTKPYLIRALYEWCSDNGYTPYIAVAVDERTIVPREFVRNGEIVLNVSPLATNHLQIANDLVSFQARFGGIARELSIPVENVISIYARETGHGMAFEVTRPNAEAPEAAPADEPPALITRPMLTSVPTAPEDTDAPDEPTPPTPPTGGGRPQLKRVK
jgi:stringent starvation protein B